MSAADHLGTYAEGWTKGDADTILKAVSDDYTFDRKSSPTKRKASSRRGVGGQSRAPASRAVASSK
jgi:hypothetical protein